MKWIYLCYILSWDEFDHLLPTGSPWLLGGTYPGQHVLVNDNDYRATMDSTERNKCIKPATISVPSMDKNI